MNSLSIRKIRLISIILIISLFTGFLPWREIRADMDTHGEYESYPFSITYEQNSTWNNSTQGQYILTNTSEYTVSTWALELEFYGGATVSNIWNASDITN